MTMRGATRARTASGCRWAVVALAAAAVVAALLATAAMARMLLLPQRGTPQLRLPLTFVAAAAAAPRRLARGAIVYNVLPGAALAAELAASLRALDAHFNDAFARPVVIFHPARARPGARDAKAAPLTAAEQEALRNCTRSALAFAEVDFEALADAAALAAAPELAYGWYTIGYRHMCNFFLQAIADQPILADYDYFWRFDAHSNLVAPVAADVFEEMHARGAAYGFASTEAEFWEFATGLQAAAEAHFGRPASAAMRGAFVGPPMQWGRDRNDAAIAACRARSDNCRNDWNLRIYFNNFEVVSLAWMRSPSYRAFAAALQKSGGIYSTRWGDAPMRTFAVEYMLDPREVLLFRDVRVEHRGGLHDTRAAAAEVLGERRWW